MASKKSRLRKQKKRKSRPPKRPGAKLKKAKKAPGSNRKLTAKPAEPATSSAGQRRGATALLKPGPIRRLRLRRTLAQPQPRPATGMARRGRALAKNPYETDLDRAPANYQPLTPLAFLRRAAIVYPEVTAIIHGRQRFTYRDFYERSRRLASALAREGIGKGDTVAALLSNTPAMLEAHHGVPMAGAVLNALNTRLDAPSIAFMLDHAEAKVFFVDREFVALTTEALRQAKAKPLLVSYDDAEFPQTGMLEGATDYETFLKSGDPDFEWTMPEDECNAIALNHTSGTTGNPKGVVYHHRGAAMIAYGNILACRMAERPVFLWTLPMFHCNGWCFPWTLALLGGTHVCLRWVRAKEIYTALAEHNVTHLAGAPTVMAAILSAKPGERRPLAQKVSFVHAAAPPPEAVLGAMLEAGFDLTHVYGLTETYGPAVVDVWKPEWNDLPREGRLPKRARQGVAYATLEELQVLDPGTMEPVPADGTTLGEVMFRGNIVMKGYLKNPKATEEAFAGGWFHSGDLGVLHPDGYIQLRDRSKDIIISGGENISSIEVENALYRHPAVLFAAVVAQPDEKWGETPCAFVEKRPGFDATDEAELIAFCRDNLAHFKCPRTVVFCELPKTTTGKIQKFRLREQAKTTS